MGESERRGMRDGNQHSNAASEAEETISRKGEKHQDLKAAEKKKKGSRDVQPKGERRETEHTRDGSHQQPLKKRKLRKEETSSRKGEENQELMAADTEKKGSLDVQPRNEQRKEEYAKYASHPEPL